MHWSITLPSEHSVAPESWTDILGAFRRGTEHKITQTQRQHSCFFWCFLFLPGLRETGLRRVLTDHNIHLVAPDPLGAAADLAAVPAMVILHRVGNLKCTGLLFMKAWCPA